MNLIYTTKKIKIMVNVYKTFSSTLDSVPLNESYIHYKEKMLWSMSTGPLVPH